MSWFSKDGRIEAMAEEYAALSRHAAKLQNEIDELQAKLAHASIDPDVAQLQRDLAFWRNEAARLSVEGKAELAYVQSVSESVRAQRAELDTLIADARTRAFREGWLYGLDQLEDTLAYYKLEEHRAKANAYDPDDDWFIPDPAADDDSIPF